MSPFLSILPKRGKYWPCFFSFSLDAPGALFYKQFIAAPGVFPMFHVKHEVFNRFAKRNQKISEKVHAP